MCRMKLVPVTHYHDKIPDKAEGREVVVHDGCGGRSLKHQVTLHPLLRMQREMNADPSPWDGATCIRGESSPSNLSGHTLMDSPRAVSPR